MSEVDGSPRPERHLLPPRTMVRLMETASRAGCIAATASNGPQLLLLTAADGPWKWQKIRYNLLGGAPPEPHATAAPESALSRLPLLGGLLASAEVESACATTVYRFDADREAGLEPLRLSQASVV